MGPFLLRCVLPPLDHLVMVETTDPVLSTNPQGQIGRQCCLGPGILCRLVPWYTDEDAGTQES